MQIYAAHNNKKNILWERRYTGRRELKKTIIVHGHTPTISTNCRLWGAISGRIFFTANDINVDCGEVYRSKRYKDSNLAAIRLEDLQEFYVRGGKGKAYENKNRFCNQ